MSAGRLRTFVYGLRHLRQAPDLVALRGARSPRHLADLALIPAGRNLGIAVGFLPADMRAEATAGLLACRVLDAHEDLTDGPAASSAVLAAANYLTGLSETPPPPLHADARRDSEAVDLVLAARVDDVRALIAALPAASRERVGLMLADIGTAMAENIDAPMPRTAYGERVLGRVVQYACALITEDACAGDELAGCIGVLAQSANDLRDGDVALYRCHDQEELAHVVIPRLLAAAVGGFALLTQLGPRTPSAAARAAVAYMAITTAAFLCAFVGAPPPYPRRLRFAAAMAAAASPPLWTMMVARVRQSADGVLHQLLEEAPALFAETAAGHTPTSLGNLIVDGTFALVRQLPADPLTGELSDSQVRRMMLADHLAFGALDQLAGNNSDVIKAVADRFRRAAVASTIAGGQS